jgi:LysM repeat protein
MNKAIFRQEKATKPGVKKPTVTKATAPKPTTPKVTTPKVDKLKDLEKKVTTAKSTAKKVTTAKATKDVSTGAKVGKVILDAAKTTAMIAGPGKFLKAGALIKGVIGANKAVKVTKAVKAAESGKKFQAANNARKAANAAKAEKARAAGTMGKVKKVGLAAAGFYALSKIPTGDGAKDAATKTLPQRPAGQYPKGGGKGLKFGPNINAGGSTTKVYRVEQGDTLSSIAKKAGVSLSELKKANPKASSQKYIFRNTSVKIPQGKAIPSGSYKGPVPYLPGSSAAKKYELSRKK